MYPISHISSEDWHKRYLQQASWTVDIRAYLLKELELENGGLFLDVGCGTGALTTEIIDFGGTYYGLDICSSSLKYAKTTYPDHNFIVGDGLSLPMKDDFFDVTFCHFLLLWVPDPLGVVKEMTRVTKPGGSVIAFAEPDYGGRIDYPDELIELGHFQITGLSEQSANPFIGRVLSSLFHDSQLKAVQIGILGGQWSGSPNWEARESEWQILESDINYLQSQISLARLDYLRKIDKRAYEQGKRILYVPTFYAAGVVS